MNIDPLFKEIIFTIALIAGVYIISRAVKFMWRRVFIRIAEKTPTKLDQMIFEYTEKPVSSLVLVAGLYLILKRLTRYPGLNNALFLKIIDGVFYAFAVMVASLFVYALTKAILDWYAKEVEKNTHSTMGDFVPMLRRIIQAVVFFIVTIILLSRFNVNISGLLATAGIASLAFALAAQDTLSNMISGFLITVDRPFRVGDRIELPDATVGDVQEIGLRSTKILSFDQNVIVLPNSEIAKARITNYGYPNPKMKIRQTISVAYGTDIEKVKNILADICRKHPDILDDPGPETYFMEFGGSSLNVLMMCWFSDYREKFRITDELNLEIKKHFEREGIQIPFPQMDVHLHSK